MNRRDLLRGGLLVGAAALPATALAKGRDDQLVAQLDREVIALKERIKILQAQVEECGSGAVKPDPIFPELVQVFADTVVQVKRKGGRTLVIIPTDTLVTVEAMTVREEGVFALDLVSTALANHPEHSVLVTGHSDSDPPPKALIKRYATPWELSLGLAHLVGQELIQTYQVDPTRVTIAGRGATDPNDTNDTPEGRAQNRRIVLTIAPGKYP